MPLAAGSGTATAGRLTDRPDLARERAAVPDSFIDQGQMRHHADAHRHCAGTVQWLRDHCPVDQQPAKQTGRNCPQLVLVRRGGRRRAGPVVWAMPL